MKDEPKEKRCYCIKDHEFEAQVNPTIGERNPAADAAEVP